MKLATSVWLSTVVGVILSIGDDVISVATGVMQSMHGRFARTDSGNAELFADLHGENVRFDHKQQRWLLWDRESHRWTEDKQARVRLLMKETARERQATGVKLPESEDRKHEIRWAKNSESRSLIDAALELTKSEPVVSDDGEGWDNDPWLIGVANGIVDLRTGQMRQATRADLITKFSPVRFDLHAKCPRFEQFISEVFGGEKELIAFVQNAVGYSLTGSVREQCLFACYGEGRNGKSTLIEILLHIFGDYGIDLPFGSLEAKSNAPAGEGVNLPGSRFAKAVEIREGRRLDEARIKSWTGGDTISVRPLYRNAVSFRPTHKLWLAFNHKPVIGDDSPGMWRRIRLIPFRQKFEGNQADQNLFEILKAEAPGILNWALQGCLMWQREGLPIPRAVWEATRQYQDESDVLVPFLEDRCSIDPSSSVSSGELWEAYLDWGKHNGGATLSRRTLGEHLSRRGYEPFKAGHDKIRTYRGLSLRAPDAGVRADAGVNKENFSSQENS